MSMHLYERCVGCGKDKYFVRTRTYRVPKDTLKNNPHLSVVDGMRSDGVLCTECFNGIRYATLGINKGSYYKRAIIKLYKLWNYLTNRN